MYAPQTQRHRKTQDRAEALTPAESSIVALVLLMLLAAIWLTASPVSTDGLATTRITVAPGDTIWSIASEHRAPGLTTSETVSLILELNELTSPTIHVGHGVRVPAMSHELRSLEYAMR